MVSHHLFWSTITVYGLKENLVGVLHVSIREDTISSDEPGGVIFEEDDLFMWFFKPVCMPEAVAESSLVAYPFSSSLFMWFVFCYSFLFEDLVDSVVADVDSLFSENFFQCDCVKWMLVSYL